MRDNTTARVFGWATVAVAAAWLAGCASAPAEPPTPAGPAPLTDAQIVEATQAAGRDGVELVVTPLIDPHVEDLRDRAERAQAANRPQRADRELVKALAITPDDPDLLQWRAELAVLREARDEAEALAKQSIALGPKSGPLCRRNWTLVKLLREARGETENAASAAAMLERCTIAPPVRM
ncbi:MAG: tetratricopeptide repeat protein [Silanimonas sp.]